MKKRNIALWLAMAVIMLLMLLAGCGEKEEEKIRELAGIWKMTVQDTEKEARYLLEHIELYEEEIALADLTSLKYVQLVEFAADKTFRFAYDVEGTKVCVREFYQGVFADLYENRGSLNEVYGQVFDPLTEEEFYQFYADLYEAGDFAFLLSWITDAAYDYETLGKDWMTGTYSIQGDMILSTGTGENEEKSLRYQIDGDQLTLTYADGIEVYFR